MSRRVDTLVRSVCGASDHEVSEALRTWCANSRAFLSFAEAHATKLRRKTRLAGTADVRGDLLAELAVAAAILRDPARRFEVRYEPRRDAGGRHADYLMRYRVNTELHVEVTRVRQADARLVPRLARVVGDKIAQFPPGAVTLLVIVVPPPLPVDRVMPDVIGLLDRSTAVGAPGTPGVTPAVFAARRDRLSAVALLTFTPEWTPSGAEVWLNSRARRPLPPDVGRYLTDLTP